MASIPIIELDQSDPVKRGQVYGEAAGNSIKKLLEIYKELFFKNSGLAWNKILPMLDPYIDKTKAFAPELLDEIKGIATGANLTFKDIFAINARSEILFDLNIFTDECSTLVALPGSTKNRSTILAQNWDWYKETESCQVILKIAQRENIPSIVTFTEAGQLAKIGMNNAGIGLVVNTLSADRAKVGIPWIFISRRILESSRMTQAMGSVLNSPKGHSMNFLIAHEDGEAVDIETSCIENNIIFPQKNTLAHTNHYIEPCIGFKDNKKGHHNPAPSSYFRLNRINKLLTQMDGKLKIESIQNILKDHFDHPFSVCLHDSDEFTPITQTSKTCLSIVMDLSQKTIFYTKGNPCQNQVESFEFI